jgi:hypothetical protein
MEDLTTEKTRVSVEEKIHSFLEGDLDHAMEMLSTLWEIASKDEDIKTPENDRAGVSLSKFYLFLLEC